MRVPTWLSAQFDTSNRRLLQVGLPLVLTGAVLLLLPVLGRAYLGDLDYAQWALVMTVIVSAPIFDLGGSILIQSVGYGRSATRTVVRRALLLSAGGACAVTVLALLLTTVVQPQGRGPTTHGDLPLVLLVTGVACVLRSVWTVQMAVLQTVERFVARTVGAALQAMLQVTICWAMLATGQGVWALPVSLSVSSVAALLVSPSLRARTSAPAVFGQPTNQTRSLAGSRIVSAFSGIVASQGDRWVLAAIATPTLLAQYDFALRLASVPLGLAVTLFQGVTSEAAMRRETGARHALMVNTIRQIAVVVAGASVVALGGVLLLWSLDMLAVDGTVVLLAGAALLWMGTNAVTAAPTFTYLGAGRPWAEIAYSVPCALTLLVGWLAAGFLGAPLLVPVVSAVAISGWSVWFLARAWRDHRL